MKFLNKKRAASTVLAGAMALSFAVPAFAAGGNTVITSTYTEPKIEVVVPQTGTAQINPYGIDVKLDATNTVTGSQIVTAPLALINKSESDISVSATVTGAATGDLKLVTAAPASGDTTKSAYVFFQMQATTLADSDIDTDGTLKAASVNPVAAAWAAFSAPGAKDVAVVEKDTTVSDIIKLKGATIGGTEQSPTSTVNSGGIALMRLGGKVVESPKEAWTAKDGFKTTIAFTFNPAKPDASGSGGATSYTVTKGSATGATDGGFAIDVTSAEAGDTVTVTVTPDSTNTTATVTVTGADSTNVTVTAGASNTYTFTMPSQNVTVDVAFS